MALNRQQHGLVALRVGRAGTADRVAFRLDVPEDVSWAATGPIAGPEVPTTTLGLPDLLPLGSVDEASYTLPSPVLDWVHEQGDFAWIGPITGTGLWLDVRRDHPLLRMVPWERLLFDAGVDVPVLRLHGHLVEPSPRPARPRIALWMTMPRTDHADSGVEVIERVMAACAEAQGQPEVHVFTDRDWLGVGRKTFGWGGPEAIVHHPPDSAFEPGGSKGHPWLTWIERTLASSSVDVLHLVGHGYLSGDSPGFAAAQELTSDPDHNWSRFVWQNELLGTMTRLGATGCVLSAAPHNNSAGALRLLASRLAAESSGPSVFEDMTSNTDGLTDAYRLLLSHPTDLPTRTRDLVITAHPAHFGIDVASRSSYQPSSTVLERAVARDDRGMPDWAAAVQSQVKMWEAQLATGDDPPRISALRSGLEFTKRSLDEMMIDEHQDPTDQPPEAGWLS